MLTLREELLLLGLKDEKGVVASCASMGLPYGLAGATLMELAIAGRIDIGPKSVAVLDATPTGDDILDEALALIVQAKKPRDGQYWVSRIAQRVARLRQRLQDRLVAKGILSREERRILWVFPADRFPEADGRPEREVRERLRRVTLRGAAPDERTALIAGLVSACGLEPEIFEKGERRAAKKRLKEIAQGSHVSHAVGASIQAVQAAVIAACVACTAATAATH